jgi:putative redox protein
MVTRRPPDRHHDECVSVTAVRHLAHAVGTTGSATPAYRVDIMAGRHDLVADEPAAAGGGDVGPTPLGLLVSALAACTAATLRMYATRKGWPLTTIEVDVRYDAHDDGPNEIARTVTVPADLTDEQRERLSAIAERTPVTLAIRAGTPINTTVESRPT